MNPILMLCDGFCVNRSCATCLKRAEAHAPLERGVNPHYEPIGVWVRGPGPGLDIEMAYLPGNEKYQEEADWAINRLVENDIKSLPDDFPEYHRSTLSPYRGMRGETVETEEYASAKECAVALS